MRRYGFLFRIRPELMQEYKKAHDEIWPELVSAIRAVGIRNYTHFYREDGVVFACFEAEDPTRSLKELSAKEIRNKWEVVMEKFFVKKDRSYLGPEVTVLQEIFHLE